MSILDLNIKKRNDRIKVLYVDDHLSNLQLFQLMFKKNCEIKIAESGKEGLEILNKQNDIDVVVSDFEMPFMNGLEFINNARKIKKNIPFFMLSCSILTNEIEEALNNNIVNHFFRKPIRRESFLNELLNYYKQI